MKKISYFALLATLLTAPSVVFAVTNFQELLQLVSGLLGGVMSALYTIVFAAFFWGIALFVLNTNDDKKRTEGRQWMLWSIVALFVMLTIWGLIGLLVNTVAVQPLPLPSQ